MKNIPGGDSPSEEIELGKGVITNIQTGEVVAEATLIASIPTLNASISPSGNSSVSEGWTKKFAENYDKVFSGNN